MGWALVPPPAPLPGKPLWVDPGSVHHNLPSPHPRLCSGIAAGTSPGRAERAEGKPGRVAAMPYPEFRGDGRPSYFSQAACGCWLCLASARTAIAQTKPNSSRAMAVTICGLFLPRASIFL